MHDYFCICADNAANGKELAALLKHSGKCCGGAAQTPEALGMFTYVSSLQNRWRAFCRLEKPYAADAARRFVTHSLRGLRLDVGEFAQSCNTAFAVLAAKGDAKNE